MMASVKSGMKQGRDIRNIGIFAHVDAGKTTLTEQLLFAAKAIAEPGRVDRGTSHTDSLDVERERGISVRAAAVALNWNGCDIRLIDTPGHADFFPEVERAICGIDAAVLVLSAVEGVQHQTRVIWRALREAGLAVLLFVNKIDRRGADPAAVIAAAQRELEVLPLPLQSYERDSELLPLAGSVSGRRALLGVLAENDESLLELFVVDSDVEPETIDCAIREQTQNGSICPVLFGSAIAGQGVSELLDAIVRYLPAPGGDPSNPLAARVFKVDHGTGQGREVYLRIFDGEVDLDRPLEAVAGESPMKANRLYVLKAGQGFVQTRCLQAGDMGIAKGLKSVMAGDIIGDPEKVRKLGMAQEPLLTGQIEPIDPQDLPALLEALRILSDEEPLLSVEWIEAVRQINIRFFGEIQMQILSDQLKRRFQLAVRFSEPKVVHKETPSRSARARVERVLPNYQAYAKIELVVEPLPQGSGFQFESQVRADLLYHKFVKQLPGILDVARRDGPRGWEVVDFKVTVVDAHSKYDLGTKHDDFKIVTPEALAKALRDAGTDLLEPCLSFELDYPEQFISPVFRQLREMRADFVGSPGKGGRATFSGRIPYAEVLAHMAALNAACHGQGSFYSQPCGYWPVNAPDAGRQ